MSKIHLCDKMTCTQCMACVNACPKGCIKMIDAGQGFFVPQIDDSECVKCGICMRSCHQIEKKLNRYTPLKTLACWTKVNSDRRNSSSGGAFSVLARKILNRKGIVYGATMDKDFQVRHIGIMKDQDLIRLQGSKYVQSYLGDTFITVRKNLQDGKLVLFTGTPCQVSGLLTFLHKKYDNLITCDMVCHGVPSQRAFNAFCERTHLIGSCDGIRFRFTEGWGYQLAREFKSHINAENPNECIEHKPICPARTWYMRAFSKNLMFNEACYTCAYSQVERVSDFTMADYWGIGDKHPFNHPTYQGISMLLVNTPKASELLLELSDLFYEERELSEAIAGNYNLSHCSERPKDRDEFISDLFDMSKKDIVNKYGLNATVRDYLRLLKQYINTKR